MGTKRITTLSFGLLLALAACGAEAPNERPGGEAPPTDRQPPGDDADGNIRLPDGHTLQPLEHCTEIQVHRDEVIWQRVAVDSNTEEAIGVSQAGGLPCTLEVQVEGAGFFAVEDEVVVPPNGQVPVRVGFAPTEAGPAAGTVRLGGERSLAELVVEAEAHTHCLSVQPEVIDFGSVLACASARDEVVVENLCAHLVYWNADAYTADGAPDAYDGAVGLASAPLLPPDPLAPGGSETFEFVYDPSYERAGGTLHLVIQEGDRDTVVEIRADGVLVPEPVTEVFTQRSGPPRDYLFVLDDGAATAPYLANLSGWIEAMLQEQRGQGFARWAVTTTSRLATPGCDGTGADGRLQPLDDTGLTWVDIEDGWTADELVPLFDVPSCSAAPSEPLAALDQALLRMDDEAAAGDAGFRQEGAALVVTILSARDDASPGPVEDWVESFEARYNAPSHFKLLHVITGSESCEGTEPGTRLRAAANQGGDLYGDFGEICEPATWPVPDLYRTSPNGPSTQFFLDEMPADQNGDGTLEDDVAVRVNGELLPAVRDGERIWSVQEAPRAISFADGHMPPQGATIEITYTPAAC